MPSASGTAQPSELPGAVGSSSLHLLQEICPSASLSEIQRALAASNGDADEAAQQLLGNILTVDYVLFDSQQKYVNFTSVIDIFLSFSLSISLQPTGAASLTDVCSLADSEDLGPKGLADCENVSAAVALQRFQEEIVQHDQPTQRIIVSRMDGTNELRADIIAIYKNPKTKLNVNPRVRFDGEDGVGCGPVREFFVNAMKIIDEGIHSSSGKPVVFLEGEADHRLPIHDQALHLTGAFKALGKMIGHSILHGGPGLHGLSPAAKHYLSTGRGGCDDELPPPIELGDIADTDLRSMISEVSCIVELLLTKMIVLGRHF